MKHFLSIICILFCFQFTFAQEGSQIVDEIAIILKAKNEQDLSRYLAPNVEITMDDVPKEHTKVQALSALDKFLKPLEILSYDIIHLSNVEEDGQYAIAKLMTKSGEYSSSLYISKIKGKYLIREISFKHEVSKGN